MSQALRSRRSEHVASRLVGFDVVQRTLIEQTLTKLYNNVQAKCRLKLELASEQLMPVFIRQLIDSVPRNIIVEVNCGYGFFSNYLSLCCPDTHIVGIETNPEKTAEAKKSVGARRNLQFIGQALVKIPKIQADLIVVNFDEWDGSSLQQLKRVHQWLAPGGDLLIRTPHPKTQWRQLFHNIRNQGFEQAFSALEREQQSILWQERIEQCGFTCLAEYDPTTALQTTLSKAASLANSYLWYHAEKPVFKAATAPPKFNAYGQGPQTRPAAGSETDHARTILGSIIESATHEGEDILSYIFSRPKPWQCLQQEISPA